MITDNIAGETTKQTEAMHAPAVISEPKPGKGIDQMRLLNVGNGPALNLEWDLAGRQGPHKLGVLPHGSILDDSYLFSVNTADLQQAAVLSDKSTAMLRCRYESLSGAVYVSENTYDFNKSRFTTRIIREGSGSV